MSVQPLQSAPKRARFEETRQQGKITKLPLYVNAYLLEFLQAKEVFACRRVSKGFQAAFEKWTNRTTLNIEGISSIEQLQLIFSRAYPRVTHFRMKLTLTNLIWAGDYRRYRHKGKTWNIHTGKLEDHSKIRKTLFEKHKKDYQEALKTACTRLPSVTNLHVVDDHYGQAEHLIKGLRMQLVKLTLEGSSHSLPSVPLAHICPNLKEVVHA